MANQEGSGTHSYDVFSRVAILGTLASHPGLSRSELAPFVGVGTAAVTRQVRRLQAMGFVRELPAQRTGIGRPRVPLELSSESVFVIGISVAGNDFAVTAQRLDGSELFSATEPLRRRESGSQLVDLITRTLEHLGAMGRCLAVGLALPGIVDAASGTVVLSLSLGMRNRSLGAELSAATAIPVFVENGARAMAVHELTFNARNVPESFVLVSIGSGIGMAIVSQSRLVLPLSDTANELGHVSVDPDGPDCECGNVGCLDGYLSLPTLFATAGRGGDSPRTVDDLLERAAADAAVADSLAAAGTVLGRAMANVATTIGIRDIIITGETTRLWSYLDAGFSTALARGSATLGAARFAVRSWSGNENANAAAGIALARILDD